MLKMFQKNSKPKLKYEKPKIEKQGKMKFPLDIIETNNQKVCKQCSSCHSCR
jgi:hypothetical protein